VGATLEHDVVDAARSVEWLLGCDEPAIVYLTRRDVLGEDVPDDAEAILRGRLVRGLLAGQRKDGGFGVHAYGKWGGAHWRLVSLVELAIPAGEPRAVRAAETVLDWLTGDGHRRRVQTIEGLVRRCGSQEGNALAVCCRLGLAEDPRVRLLAESLVEWQWPDGGWNCDKHATAHRSSFNESLAPMWGLHEYAEATGDEAARRAAARTAELLLDHRVFRSLQTGEAIRPEWLLPHWPPYWHYDAPHALLILTRMGLAGDERARDALDELMGQRRADGTWRSGRTWWRRPGSPGSNVEVVDWGGVPYPMVTLNALRILRSAGRLSL
jgi:hypothetical protein